MKQKLGLILRGGILLAVAAAAMPALGQGRIAVLVDNQPVHFPAAQPQMVQGRVLVPFRGVMERLMANVDWDPAARMVVAQRGDNRVVLRIGQRVAEVDGRTVLLDVPAMVIQGTTMVPLRFVGEALGADVEWDARAQTVLINTADIGIVTERERLERERQQREREQRERTERERLERERQEREQQQQQQQVRIESFNHSATGWLREGQTIDFTLRGTPGGQASIIIPGIEREIAMTEREPGVYVAEWTPRPVDNRQFTLAQASVLARLRVNGTERMIQAGQNISVDIQRPEIRTTLPEGDARVVDRRPNVSAVLDDRGSGIDPQSVRIFVNNQDVTQQATVTANFVTWRASEDMQPGRYEVRVVARDRAGNQAEQTWTFNVEGTEDLVTTFAHTGREDVRPGQEIRFRLDGRPGLTITLDIGDRVRDLPMREESPGIYRAYYTVRETDRFANEPVTARIQTPQGQRFTVEATQRVAEVRTAGADPMRPPTITQPAAGTTAASPLVIRGTAAPGARVHVRVEYATTMLGLLRTTGALADLFVDANDRGEWATEAINLDTLIRGQNTEYTITARVVGEGDQRSEAVTRTLRG
jgi:hypothetical protein